MSCWTYALLIWILAEIEYWWNLKPFQPLGYCHWQIRHNTNNTDESIVSFAERQVYVRCFSCIACNRQSHLEGYASFSSFYPWRISGTERLRASQVASFSCSVVSDSLWYSGLQPRQASLFFTISCSLLKLMSVESVMPSHPLPSPSPSVFPRWC